MAYRERPTAAPGVVLWQRAVGPGPATTRILPDGCLDLLWDGSHLVVAGPDTAARRHDAPPGASYVGLRFSSGTGPALLGLRADEVVDRSIGLEELWPAAPARALTERAAADAAWALESWVLGRAACVSPDPLGARVFGLAAAGTPVAAMADAVGVGTRQLGRRCLALFGYGPLRLARVLRFARALEEARGGVPVARVAAGCGYADQAHFSREVRALAGTTPGALLRELGGR